MSVPADMRVPAGVRAPTGLSAPTGVRGPTGVDGAPVSPLRAVLAALADPRAGTQGTGGGSHGGGAVPVEALAARTGLDPSVVSAVVDHLTRLGRLAPLPLASGCPTTRCGSCALSRSCR